MKYLYNTTGSAIVILGYNIDPNTYFSIPPEKDNVFSSDSSLITNITSSNIILSKTDDSTGHIIDINESLDFLKNKSGVVVTLSANPPFADKKVLNKRLFAREAGIPGSTILANSTSNIDYTIPYTSVKITGAQILNCGLGDTVNFKVLDTATGAVTTIPYYCLNQFGINVNMPEGEYVKRYPYDADLFGGLIIRIEYTNNSNSDRTVYVNLDLHELKD